MLDELNFFFLFLKGGGGLTLTLPSPAKRARVSERWTKLRILLIKDKPISDSASTKRYPVLIAGAGPVGLSLAIELACRGIRCPSSSRADGLWISPRPISPIREPVNTCAVGDRRPHAFESGYPTDYPSNYLFVSRMDGYEIARFDHPANGVPNSRSPYSPEGRLWISKPYFDPVLRKHVETLAAGRIRYQTAFESFDRTARQSGREIIDVTPGKEEIIEADYLVGCDGGRSNIRRALGIKIPGRIFRRA